MRKRKRRPAQRPAEEPGVRAEKPGVSYAEEPGTRSVERYPPNPSRTAPLTKKRPMFFSTCGSGTSGGA